MHHPANNGIKIDGRYCRIVDCDPTKTNAAEKVPVAGLPAPSINISLSQAVGY